MQISGKMIRTFVSFIIENGFKKVKFHVQGDMKEYTKREIELIRKTVVELLKCKAKDIFVSGLDHSSSFFVIVSIREDYIRNLFELEEHDEEKLASLRINCFIVDCVTVYLNVQKGKFLINLILVDTYIYFFNINS